MGKKQYPSSFFACVPQDWTDSMNHTFKFQLLTGARCWKCYKGDFISFWWGAFILFFNIIFVLWGNFSPLSPPLLSLRGKVTFPAREALTHPQIQPTWRRLLWKSFHLYRRGLGVSRFSLNWMGYLKSKTKYQEANPIVHYTAFFNLAFTNLFINQIFTSQWINSHLCVPTTLLSTWDRVMKLLLFLSLSVQCLGINASLGKENKTEAGKKNVQCAVYWTP